MRWFGEIAFKDYVEEESGVWVPKLIKKNFYGDIIKASWKESANDKINADLHISNRLSVVADPFLQNNFHKIAYIKAYGAKWTVSDVELVYPRLTLSLGSLYLEEEEDNEDEG